MEFINSIIRFSLRHRLAVGVATLLIIVGGLYGLRHMRVDVFPDLTAPTVVIMTDAEGMAPEEVERLVTFPIETAVNGAANVRRVRSASLHGVSFVWTEFDWGTDVYRARQTISEKMVTLADALPGGITPVLAPQSSIMGEILMVSLEADSTSMMELRTLADWVVKPAILATGGVSQVTNIGGELKQFQILADPVKMERHGVSLDQIRAVGATFSENSVGGIVREFGNEYAVRGVARASDPDELARSVIALDDSGEPVVLADVARVVVAPAQRLGNATVSGRPAILMAVSKQPDINTLEVTDAIERNLDNLRASLPADVRMNTRVFRQADFIEAAVDNVGDSLLEGALFAVVILIIFLASWRTTVISVVTIPISLLGTCAVLWALGMEINTMTLGGMCLAIGSLVDDAIIDVENVYKRLRQNHALPAADRLPAVKVVYEASREIRASILNATLIIIVAFVPLFFLSGMEGRMLKPLGTAYVISLFMSLAVAMTLTPLLCLLMLSPSRYLSRNEREGRVSRLLQKWYAASLERVMARGRRVIGITVVLFVAAVGLFLSMGRTFLPDFNEGSAVVAAVAQPGVSLDVNDELGYMLERELLKVPEVTGTARRSGRGELDEHSQATNGAEIEVQFTLGGRSRREIFDDMRARMAAVPGVATSVGQPLGHRIDHMMSGTRAAIAVKVFGPDLSTLYATGQAIRQAVEDIPGLVDVAVEQQVETPQLQIRANRDALARNGITIEQFNAFVASAFAGDKIGDIYQGDRKFDVVLRLDSAYSGSRDNISRALIDNGFGSKIPLSEVADVVSAGGPGSISRENVQRKLVVSANVSGRDAASVVDEMKERIAAQVVLPEGYRIEYGGQFESADSAARTLLVATLLALLVIYLLLLGEFSRPSLAALVLLNLPFALIGGVFAVFFTSGFVSIPGIIGFITLFGVATRNGILLVSEYRRLADGGMPPAEAVRAGSIDRLNPILMTALTSGLALIPLVLNGDKAGNEIQSPMAVVVLGGLFTSTLLNIYVMPVVYRWYAGRSVKTEK